MSSQLSERDFQRLQETLLELKTRNYTLEDQSRKQRNALGDATAKVTVLQQELSKAQKTIEKSRKITEVQKVINENDNLHKKILAQEEDFRLQNQTLLNELSLLVSKNEKLEKQSEVSTNEASLENVVNYKEELHRELAKNSSLQDEISLLRQKELERITDEFSLDDNEITFKNLKDKENIVSDYKRLKVEVDEERSENKNMKEKLQEVQENVKSLTEENEKLKNVASTVEEKLKKKQAVFTEVQTEKDKIIETLKTENIVLKEKVEKVESVSSGKEKESIKELQGKVLQLQKKLEASGLENERKLLDKEKLLIEFDKLSVDFTGKVNQMEEMTAQNSRLAQELESQKNVSEKRKNLIDEMAREIQKKVDEQQEKSVQYNLSLAKLTDEKCEVISEFETRITSMNEEIEKLKLTTMKYKELRLETEALKQSKQEHEAIIDDYKESLEALKLEKESEKQDLKNEHSVEIEKMLGDFERKTKEFEMQLELTNVQKCEFEETVTQLKQEIKDNLEDRKISEKKGNALVKDLKRQLQSEKNKNEKLQEKMKECFETSSNISEPSRVVGEVEPDRTSVSSWSLMSGQNERDTSTPSQLTPSPFHSSNGISNEQFSEDSPHDLTQENEALLARISRLQQENWVLEEKLSMLELSGGQMAEELVSKTKLIQQYCMDTGAKRAANRSVPTTPSSDKVKTFVDKLDKFVNLDSQKDSVHKQEVSNMQKMLEETLLKNMHLQQDLENMSQELVRLSKLAVPQMQ